MKMLKCDRCGAVDRMPVRIFGTSPFYMGCVKYYSYADEPTVEDADLCGACQAKLDGWVRAFMDEVLPAKKK